MAYVDLEDFLSRLETSQQQQVKSAAHAIDRHKAIAQSAEATKEKLGLTAAFSGMCFLMLVGDLFFHNGFIREVQLLLGYVGVAAATLTGPILGGRWLKAKLTADRERRKAWDLDDKWFAPLGGRYANSDYEPKGKVYISEPRGGLARVASS
jgi:hypothetical protein